MANSVETSDAAARQIIEVAVGVVFDQQPRVLLGQRVKQDAYYQKWEFPGGKLESGENAAQALERELAEEVGIRVNSSSEFMLQEHSYPDRDVRLFVRVVDSFSNSAVAREGQAIKWVALSELAQIDFLSGNTAIIKRLIERYPS